MNKYDKQAIDFLNKTGTTLSIKFLEARKYWPDSKFPTDIYEFTLTKESRSYSSEFSQSLNCSGKFWKYGDYKKGITNKPFADFSISWEKNKNFEVPNEYDILSCLVVYCYDSIDDLCEELDLNIDSVKDLNTAKKVLEQGNGLRMLFNDKELELLGEIQ